MRTAFLIVILAALGCSPRMKSQRAQADPSHPTAIVRAESAVFIFPMPQGQVWEWSVRGDTTESHLYFWWALWGPEARYGLSAELRGPAEGPQRVGSLAELVRRSRPYVLHVGGDVYTMSSDTAARVYHVDGAVRLTIGRSAVLDELRRLRPDSATLMFAHREYRGRTDTSYTISVPVIYQR
jgi:hypothetical protein